MTSVITCDIELLDNVTPGQGRKLEHAQMRAIRRATGQPLFHGADGQDSDEVIRARFGIPSISSVLRQRRLAHLARIQHMQLPALSAIIQNHSGKWSGAVAGDLRRLAEHPKLAAMPSPAEDPQAWMALMRDKEWKALTRLLRSPVSEWPPRAPPGTYNLLDPAQASVITDSGLLPCLSCRADSAPCFDDEKGRKQHMRIKHGERSVYEAFYSLEAPVGSAPLGQSAECAGTTLRRPCLLSSM